MTDNATIYGLDLDLEVISWSFFHHFITLKDNYVELIKTNPPPVRISGMRLENIVKLMAAQQRSQPLAKLKSWLKVPKMLIIWNMVLGINYCSCLSFGGTKPSSRPCGPNGVPRRIFHHCYQDKSHRHLWPEIRNLHNVIAILQKSEARQVAGEQMCPVYFFNTCNRTLCFKEIFLTRKTVF